MYIIRAREELGRVWAWSPELANTPHQSDGTVLSERGVDQAALDGLLSRIRDLGLTIVSVERADGAESR